MGYMRNLLGSFNDHIISTPGWRYILQEVLYKEPPNLRAEPEEAANLRIRPMYSLLYTPKAPGLRGAGLPNEEVQIPTSTPNVPLLKALWSLVDGVWGLLKGSWGVLVLVEELGPNRPNSHNRHGL